MSRYIDQILGIYAPDVPGVREALTAIVETEIARRNQEPARIDPLLAQLRAIWLQYPDLRFTQLLLNVLKGDACDYYLEDAELVTRLRDRYSVDQPGGQE